MKKNRNQPRDKHHPMFVCIFMMIVGGCLVVLGQKHACADDSVWQKAGGLIKQGNYSAALENLQKQCVSHPQNHMVLKLQGVCLMELGDQDAAVLALREALAQAPESISTRYFLAQALAYRGSIMESIQILQYIIQTAPESEYARLSQGILPDLVGLAGINSAITDIQRWNLYLSITEEYDDNVPTRPKLGDETSPSDSWRTVYSFYGEFRFFDQKFDKQPFSLGTGFSVNGSLHEESSLDDYDMFSHALSVFLSKNGYWGEKAYELRLQPKYSQTDLNNENYSDIFGLEFRMQNQWSPAFLTNLSFNYQNKDFENDSLLPEYYSRSGNEYQIGIAGYYNLLRNRLILGLKYAYRWSDSEGILYKIRSHELSSSANLSLPWSLRFFAKIGYKQEDYPEYTPSPPGRLDNIWNLHLSLERPIYKKLMYLQFHYSRTASESDEAFAEYKQNIVGFSINCSI